MLEKDKQVNLKKKSKINKFLDFGHLTNKLLIINICKLEFLIPKSNLS